MPDPTTRGAPRARCPGSRGSAPSSCSASPRPPRASRCSRARAWLIVRATEQPPVLYLSVGDRRRAGLRARPGGVPLPRAARGPRCLVPPARDDPRGRRSSGCCRSRPTASPEPSRRPARARSSTTSTSCRTCRCASSSRSSRGDGRSCAVGRRASRCCAASRCGGARLPRARHRRDPARAGRAARARRARRWRRCAASSQAPSSTTCRRSTCSSRSTPRRPARRRIDEIGARLAPGDALAGRGDGGGIRRHVRGRRHRRRREPGRRRAAASRRGRIDGPPSPCSASCRSRSRRSPRRCRSPRAPCASRGRAPSGSRPRCPPTCRPRSRCRPRTLAVGSGLRSGAGHRAAACPGALAGRGARPQANAAAALDGVDLDVAPGRAPARRRRRAARARRRSRTCSCGSSTTRGPTGSAAVEASDLEADDRAAHSSACASSGRWLFDEDIRQNLLFARDTATDADLLEVLDRVGLGDWLDERGGLDARVGERGALVSGGQAQRIALARAMLRGFPVLVLDEPTAGVDPARADALLRDLTDAASRSGRTVVLISHGAVDPRLVDRTSCSSPGAWRCRRPRFRSPTRCANARRVTLATPAVDRRGDRCAGPVRPRALGWRMPRRIRSRPLPAWRDPEVVFRARFADAPYAVWLDGGADATSGVSVLAAAHPAASSSRPMRRPARSPGPRRSPTARRVDVAASVFDVLAERLPHAGPASGASRMMLAPAARRPSAGSAGSATSSAPGSTTCRRRRPRRRMPRSSSSTGRSCSTTAPEPCGSPGSSRRCRACRGRRGAVGRELAVGARRRTRGSAAEAARRHAPTAPDAAPPCRWRHGPERYAALIADCQDAIVRGDAYQLCLTNRVDVDVRPDPARRTSRCAPRARATTAAHPVRRGRAAQRVARAVPPRRRRGIVSTKPIKGTRPRGADARTTPRSGASSSPARRSAPRTS